LCFPGPQKRGTGGTRYAASLSKVIFQVPEARSPPHEPRPVRGGPDLGWLGFVVSHPCREKTAAWMGHPDFWVDGEGWVGVVLSQVPKCEGSPPHDQDLSAGTPDRGHPHPAPGLGSWYPTHAAKRLRHGWGTRICGWMEKGGLGLWSPRSPKARDLHPTDQDLSAGTRTGAPGLESWYPTLAAKTKTPRGWDPNQGRLWGTRRNVHGAPHQDRDAVEWARINAAS